MLVSTFANFYKFFLIFFNIESDFATLSYNFDTKVTFGFFLEFSHQPGWLTESDICFSPEIRKKLKFHTNYKKQILKKNMRNSWNIWDTPSRGGAKTLCSTFWLNYYEPENNNAKKM